MSQLIETLYLSGRNLYVVIHAGGQVWNKDTLAFENYNQANWAHYAVTLSEQTSSGYYFATYPTDIPEGTLSTECLYQQNGVSPVLPALPGGDSFLDVFQSQGTNMQNIGGDGSTMLNLKAAADSEVRGAAVSGTLSTTQMTTNLSAVDSAFVGRVIIFTSGANIRQATIITAFAQTNGLITFGAVTAAPSAADTFVIV